MKKMWTRAVRTVICGILSIAMIVPGNIALAAENTADNNLEITPMAEGSINPVMVKKVDAGGTLNLTEKGDLDWIHPTGSNTPDITVERKSGAAPIIGIRNLSTKNTTSFGDSPITYTWTDGTTEAVNAGTRNGCVFNSPAEANVDITEEAGYELSIPAADMAREFSFVTGAWNNKAEFFIYVDDATEPVYTTQYEAGGGAVTERYNIVVKRGYGIRVKCVFKRKGHNDGNITLAAALLSEMKVPAGEENWKEMLNELVNYADSLDLSNTSDWAKNQILAELSEAKVRLADPNAAAVDYYLSYVSLEGSLNAIDDLDTATYKYQTNAGLVASFGWEGDKDAPISYIDGSYKLRDNEGKMITFGVKNVTEKIKWYNAEGYLPCFVSEYGKDGVQYKIENFADKVTVNGNDFEIAYSRMTVDNQTAAEIYMPKVSRDLIPLNEAAKNPGKIAAGSKVVLDYAIGADRFGNTYAYPKDSEILALGTFDEHYNHMKNYWNERLAPLAEIVTLPDEQLINAYKAGFIYQLIIRDDVNGNKELHVGENGYDIMFDHDTIGMVATLLTMGDFTYAKDYLAALPAQLQYDDAKWKYSWPFALYLQKTGDKEFVQEKFAVIKENTHKIETDRVDGGSGIMKATDAIDSRGQWTIDNWSALAGLTTYRYICNELGETAEAQWALEEYNDLYKVVNDKLQETMTNLNLDYIPMSMVEANETGPRKDPRDANWASMFLFGRWGWDGYLFGAEQEGLMFDKIDDTYAYGFKRRESLTDNPYNFGGYPHGFFSSAYNAGYGSTALRGEAYRDSGIKGYQFMIEEAMSGPFGWWEGVAYPNESSPWDIPHASGGGGSCQHMWGQSTATKVLYDSLIAEKADGTVIVGRGIPVEWIQEGKKVEIKNYPIKNGKKLGYSMTVTGKTVNIEFTGDFDAAPVSVELIAFKNNIADANGLKVDQEKGIVIVPAGTEKVQVTLIGECLDRTAADKILINVSKLNPEDYTKLTYQTVKTAEEEVQALFANPERTQKMLDAAIAKLEKTLSQLIPANVNKYVDFTTGKENSYYAFGQASDQVRRYQTFVSPDTDGILTSAEVKIAYGGSGSLGDVIASIYTLKADNKSLDTLLQKVFVSKEDVKSANITKIRFRVPVKANTHYALVLGQERVNSQGGNYTWATVENNDPSLYFMKDKGESVQDESNLGKGYMKIAVSLGSKQDLEDAIVNAESKLIENYTQNSIDALKEVITRAKIVLAADCTIEELTDALTSLEKAVNGLYYNTEAGGGSVVKPEEPEKPEKPEADETETTVTDKENNISAVIVTKKDSDGKVISVKAELTVSKETTKVKSGKAEVKQAVSKEILEALAAENKQEKAMTLKVKLAWKDTKKQLTSKVVKSVAVTVAIPEIKDTDKVKVDSIVLPKDVLLLARNQKKDIKITVTDSKGKVMFGWSFDDKDLAKIKTIKADMNLKVTQNTLKEDKGVSKLLPKAKGSVISFGTLPLKGTVTSKAAGLKAGSTVYVYKLNRKTGELTALTKNKQKVDKNGYISFEVTKGGEYVVSDKKVSKS